MFAACNAVAKYLVLRLPVGEMLFARSAFALLLLAPLLRRADFAALRRTPDPGLHLLRCLCSAIEVACYYWAITLLPLAETGTIYLAGPIYVTALAAIFLHESVGWRRWAAVLVGFAGVLVALHPAGGPTVSAHALVALGGSLLYAISQVTTRQLRQTPTRVLVATQMAALLVLSTFTAAPILGRTGWAMPTALEAVMMATIGVLAMLAYACANNALQRAPASVVAPFQYASILAAIALGYLVFAEIPTVATLAGAGLIVAAGGFILMRENRPRTARPCTPPARPTPAP